MAKFDEKYRQGNWIKRGEKRCTLTKLSQAIKIMKGICMEAYYKEIVHALESRLALEPMASPKELSEIRWPLGFFSLRCWNMRAEKIRKIYFMRMSLKFPAFEYLGLGMYPDQAHDLPIFYLDLSRTSTKAIAYINPIAPVPDEACAKKYLAPFGPIFCRHHFPAAPIRPWMQPFVSPCTVYTMPDAAMLGELKQCGLAYVECYLCLLGKAEKIIDADYETKIAGARNNYIAQSLANDVTQKMLARLIGKKRAGRIFREMLT